MCLLAAWINRYHLGDHPIWKSIIDHKYDTTEPNVFCCPEKGASPFWKGVLWASKAAKLGVSWKVGNGKTIRFWEDHWFGNCSLAIQFWDLYVLAEQTNKCIVDLWDGRQLLISFRRKVSPRLMRMWLDLVAIAESISYSDDCDAIVWAFHGSSKFSVQAIYKTISFRGITPVFTPSIWTIIVPPRVHIFLWLLASNKILTRDNLVKRNRVDDLNCLFCTEPETVHHLFFECVVAKVCWAYLVDIFDIDLGFDFESVARWWVSNSKHKIMNCCSSALMWSLWKSRNEICFQGKTWMGEKLIIKRMVNMLQNWRILFSDGDWNLLNQVLVRLNNKLNQPLELLGTSSTTLPQSSLMTVSGSSLDLFPGRQDSTIATGGATEPPSLPQSPRVPGLTVTPCL